MCMVLDGEQNKTQNQTVYSKVNPTMLFPGKDTDLLSGKCVLDDLHAIIRFCFKSSRVFFQHLE